MGPRVGVPRRTDTMRPRPPLPEWWAPNVNALQFVQDPIDLPAGVRVNFPVLIEPVEHNMQSSPTRDALDGWQYGLRRNAAADARRVRLTMHGGGLAGCRPTWISTTFQA